MDLKLLKATLCEYAPVSVLREFIEKYKNYEHMKCGTCRWNHKAYCCNRDSDDYGKQIYDYYSCHDWEEK